MERDSIINVNAFMNATICDILPEPYKTFCYFLPMDILPIWVQPKIFAGIICSPIKFKPSVGVGLDWIQPSCTNFNSPFFVLLHGAEVKVVHLMNSDLLPGRRVVVVGNFNLLTIECGHLFALLYGSDSVHYGVPSTWLHSLIFN